MSTTQSKDSGSTSIWGWGFFIVGVIAAVAWLFFFNGDVTGTWTGYDGSSRVEVVFDQGGTGALTVDDGTSSKASVTEFSYEMNDGYLLFQTKTTLDGFGKTYRIPCEVHGNTMTWDLGEASIEFTRS